VVFNEHGEPVGAVSLSAPAVRLPDERIARLAALVRGTAAAIAGAFGGNR